jgi:hypothetical protein
MLPDDPGWFWDREPMPFGPRVIEPTTFARLGDELAPVLGSSDDVLLGASTTIATTNNAGLEDEFLLTIGAAAAEADAHAHDADDPTAADLVDAGAGADARRAEVSPHIPEPDASITASFLALPDMPGPPAGSGSGGDPDPGRD